MRRPASSYRRVWIGAILLILSVACRVAETEPGSTAPSLRDLMRRNRQEQRAVVIYGGAAGVKSRVEAIGQGLASNRGSWDITIRQDHEIDEEELGRTTVYLVGTSQSNRWINELAPKLPFQILDDGFTSTPAPWRHPHERDRRKPVSLEDQVRCYEVAFQGLKSSIPWIRGVYWWKWPSVLEHGGQSHTGFTPNGKPAENIVRKWYSEVW